MGWTRIVGAVVLVVGVVACGGDDGDGGDAGETPTTVAEATCPGEEIGPVPGLIEVAAPTDPQVPDATLIDVAFGPDGFVYAVADESVYCIDGDRVFEAAAPSTYPDAEEWSTYVGIAVDPEGTPLVADWKQPRTFAVVDGDLELLPGSDDPAIGGSRSIAAGPDGTVYVTGLDASGSQGVYAIGDGAARLYAGAPDDYSDDNEIVAGDGGPAVDSWLNEPEGIAVDPDGSLYIADRGHQRVAVVDPDGTIDTLIGGTGFDDRPDSDDLGSPQDVAIDPSGAVLVLHLVEGGWAIDRVADDGTAEPVLAEGGTCQPRIEDFGEVEVETCPVGEIGGDAYRFDVDADGGLWIIADGALHRVVGDEVEPVLAIEVS